MRIQKIQWFITLIIIKFVFCIQSLKLETIWLTLCFSQLFCNLFNYLMNFLLNWVFIFVFKNKKYNLGLISTKIVTKMDLTFNKNLMNAYGNCPFEKQPLPERTKNNCNLVLKLFLLNISICQMISSLKCWANYVLFEI